MINYAEYIGLHKMNILKSRKFFSFILIILLMSCFICTPEIWAAKNTSNAVNVQFTAKDGFNLTGSLCIPKNKSAKNRVPLAILLHSIGGTRMDWLDYPNKIKNLGIAVLVVDLRGHGQSIINKNGRRRYWQNFNDKEFQKFSDDIISAINYIKTQYPEIDVNKIALIGSDIGANAAVVASGQYSKGIKTLVLLSPTTDFKGIDTRIPMVSYGNHPVLIMVSHNDRFSYFGASELIKYAQGKKVLKVFPYGGNGIDLLKFQPESQKIIINWLNTCL